MLELLDVFYHSVDEFEDEPNYDVQVFMQSFYFLKFFHVLGR